MNANPFISKATILITDNDPANLASIGDMLKNHCARVKLASNGEQALAIALSNPPPDIMLLAVDTPKIDGFEICKQIKNNATRCDIPIIFLTEKDKPVDETRGFKLGAADFIAKPVDPDYLFERINTHLEAKSAKNTPAHKDADIGHDSEERLNQLITAQNLLIQTIIYMGESRDNVTGNHARRIQYYVRALAKKLRFHPRFSYLLDDDDYIELLIKTSALHDLGNLEIPDRILLKPGALTPDEFEVMKTHTRLGKDIIIRAEKDFGVEIPFLKCVKEITYCHHENWNGSGYPEGIAGDNIPISARVMSVADVYDALVSRRVYKSAMSHDEAVKIILANKGVKFDPDIVDAFHEIHLEFQRITHVYADTAQDFKRRLDYMEQALAVEP